MVYNVAWLVCVNVIQELQCDPQATRLDGHLVIASRLHHTDHQTTVNYTARLSAAHIPTGQFPSTLSRTFPLLTYANVHCVNIVKVDLQIHYSEASETLDLNQTNIAISRGWHSVVFITHVGHSIVFDVFLHFVTLWPWPLTFWPNINCWTRTRDGLSQWNVWRLYFQPFWFYRADK